MSNRDKLRRLLLDVFLLSEADFHWDLTREQVPTWDSLGTVSLIVGLQQTFGCQLAQEEALGIRGVPDVLRVLAAKGVALDD